MTSIDRTAYPGFKRVISAAELAEAFTPTTDDVSWARGRTQGETNLLALVVSAIKKFPSGRGLAIT